jgi:hypothetical protein
MEAKDKSMKPRLTVAIPTLNRTVFLERAIGCCLAQHVPVNVLVSDQGGTEEVAAVMKRFSDHPQVEHVLSHADTLLENWRFAARAAMDRGAEFFAWFQDDDRLAQGYSRKVLYGFDRWPNAVAWLARLMCGDVDGNVRWDIGNGPPIPMRVLDGEPCSGPGIILIPGQYCMSWALSPAVAFRCGEAFGLALDRMPIDCDLMSERTILAAIGLHGNIICDPIVCGAWVQHEGNEHRRQNAQPGESERQMTAFVQWLDGLMDEAGEKAYDVFTNWVEMLTPAHITMWLEQLAHDPHKSSKHCERLGTIMAEMLGRLSPLPPDMQVSRPMEDGDVPPTTAGDIVTVINCRLRMDELLSNGKYDTEEVEVLRERMDPCWRRLHAKELNPDRLIQEICGDIKASKKEVMV